MRVGGCKQQRERQQRYEGKVPGERTGTVRDSEQSLLHPYMVRTRTNEDKDNPHSHETMVQTHKLQGYKSRAAATTSTTHTGMHNHHIGRHIKRKQLGDIWDTIRFLRMTPTGYWYIRDYVHRVKRNGRDRPGSKDKKKIQYGSFAPVARVHQSLRCAGRERKERSKTTRKDRNKSSDKGINSSTRANVRNNKTIIKRDRVLTHSLAPTHPPRRRPRDSRPSRPSPAATRLHAP